MTDSIRVAAACVESKPGRAGENLRKIEELCRKAASEGVQLVLFPELSVCGFLPNHPAGDHAAWLRRALASARNMAETVPGPAVDSLASIAAATGIYIGAGLLENAGNVLYNTHVLVGPSGLSGAWRKMHIPMFEMPFYNGGEGPVVVATPLGRIGANICFDVLLPESTRLLAVQNVEIALFPFAADPPPGTAQAWAAWGGPAIRARCAENGVFGVACNYAGHVEWLGVEQTFPGGAIIAGPRGEVLAGWTAESCRSGMAIADIGRQMLEAARAEPEYLFRFRRPELYGPLAG